MTATQTAAPPAVTVPLLDLKAQYDTLRDEIEPVVREVVESQWFIMGPKVAELEAAIADYCDTKYAVGCASGSDAILLALMAINLQPGDEVICPAYTFFSTASSITRLGGVPVFADIDPVTFNLNLDHVAELAANCKKLKAIMPVHLFGQSVDMTAYLKLGERHGVPIIEDAAQAIGSKDATGAMSGSRGAIGCFSFFPSKNLGGFGDGGIVTTNNDSYREQIAQLRNHGMEPKYYHQSIGLNSRLDALQAAVLNVKLKYLDEWHEGRRRNATHYDEMFHAAGAVDSRTPLNGDGFPLRTPYRPDEPARHIYNQYVIRVPEDQRDALRAHLAEHNVSTEIYYPVPLHLQECFNDLGYEPGSLPETERAAKQTIALPIYPELTVEQREHVARTIIEFLK